MFAPADKLKFGQIHFFASIQYTTFQIATEELNNIIQEYLYQTDNTRRGYPYNR